MNPESTPKSNPSSGSHWLRWSAVLPAALLSYFGVQVAVALARGIEDGFAERIDYKSQFICSIIGPYVLVWVGAKTAPQYRFVTAMSLAALHAAALGSIATLGIVYDAVDSGAMWWLIACSVVGTIATIVACVHVRRLETPDNRTA